jgi:hypothetical protein
MNFVLIDTPVFNDPENLLVQIQHVFKPLL